MFATMKPYVPPPPPGGATTAAVGNPEDHVRELFGNRVEGCADPELRALRVTHFATPGGISRLLQEQLWGPRSRPIQALPTIRIGLRWGCTSVISLILVCRFDLGTDRTVLDWEYLLFVARKAG